MILILEIAPWCQAFNMSHKHLKRQGIVHFRSIYSSALRPSLPGDLLLV